MASSARCQGDADSDVESTAEELEEEQRERNLTMFSKRHLFVELHELKNNEWHETKRYNYGLEEDLATDGPKRHWTKAHLPSISVFGMLAFRDCLHEDLVILDVASQSATGASQLEPVALAIVDHLVSDGAVVVLEWVPAVRSQQFGEVPEVPLDEGVWKPHDVDHRVGRVDGIRTVVFIFLVHRLLVPAHARVVEPGIRTVILTVSRTHGRRLMVGSKR